MSNDCPKDARGLIDPVRAAEQDRERRRRFYSDQPGSPRFEGGEAWEEFNQQPPRGSAHYHGNAVWNRKLAEAHQAGQDAALLGMPLNPYRKALKAAEGYAASLAFNLEQSDAYERAVNRSLMEVSRLRALAQQWEDGYVSASK